MSSLPETKHSPPPARRGPPQSRPVVTAAPTSTEGRFAISSTLAPRGERVLLYGPGGIGKSTLASLAPGAVFLDLEDSTTHFKAERVSGIETWADLRACLQSDALDSYRTIVIDSITRAEEWAAAHTLATVPHEKGNKVLRLEDYGFGKGYQMVFEIFGLLLPDLDRHVRAGRNVVLIAHECVADVPNPAGEDFLRFEPHLQAPKSGKASIRERVFQWVDHALFVAYDVVTKDKKGLGGGTRTIWPVERPDHRAKSRSIAEPLAYESATDGAIWPLILGGAS
jgi:energy-coupling factor transporter ATP-binding protein EcfA2